jgi:hypothetical protein
LNPVRRSGLKLLDEHFLFDDIRCRSSSSYFWEREEGRSFPYACCFTSRCLRVDKVGSAVAFPGVPGALSRSPRDSSERLIAARLLWEWREEFGNWKPEDEELAMMLEREIRLYQIILQERTPNAANAWVFEEAEGMLKKAKRRRGRYRR